ncbi:MAG: hypothetical protein J6I31_08995 [Prevotella sp.]|nr:hypothetical protein [Prevotella sp.]
MNQQEFTDRTGYTPCTEEEWKAIEMMYLEAGESVDKDLFCKEWLEHKDSNLLRIFYKRAMDKAETLEYFNDMRTETAKFLIDKANDLGDNDLYWQAVKLIGQKRVILYKIEKDYDLNRDDKEYINDNIQ